MNARVNGEAEDAAKGRDALSEEDGAARACPDAVTMAGYLDGKLDGNERRRLEAHLKVCAACRQEVEELREILAEGEIAPDTPESARALDELVRNAKKLAGK